RLIKAAVGEVMGVAGTAGVSTRPGREPLSDKAKKEATVRLLMQLATALDVFEMHIGRYPTADEGLGALLTKPIFEDESEGMNWCGPYIKRVPRDAWNQRINYKQTEPGSKLAAEGVGYRLWSNGPNRQSGDEDDIKTWTEDDLQGK
ncbi:hypothetical protein LCGC14_3092290, partial [marine sediment metagenome]